MLANFSWKNVKIRKHILIQVIEYLEYIFNYATVFLIMESTFVIWWPQEFKWNKQNVEGLITKVVLYFIVRACNNFGYVFIFSPNWHIVETILMLTDQGYKYTIGRIVALTKQAIAPGTALGHLNSTSATFPRTGHPDNACQWKIGIVEHWQVPVKSLQRPCMEKFLLGLVRICCHFQ